MLNDFIRVYFITKNKRIKWNEMKWSKFNVTRGVCMPRCHFLSSKYSSIHFWLTRTHTHTHATADQKCFCCSHNKPTRSNTSLSFIFREFSAAMLVYCYGIILRYTSSCSMYGIVFDWGGGGFVCWIASFYINIFFFFRFNIRIIQLDRGISASRKASEVKSLVETTRRLFRGITLSLSLCVCAVCAVCKWAPDSFNMCWL